MTSAADLTPQEHFVDYSNRLCKLLASADWGPVSLLAEELFDCWKTGRQVFICGNGGSAGNAIHLANDFLYALSKKRGSGLRVSALPANAAVLTCLANDQGYESIYSLQLAVQARRDDVLIVFSGSGNSPNILEALKEASKLGMKSYAVLGFDGGKAKELADIPIHFDTDDMQHAEDVQLILGHMLMQWLYARKDQVK